MHSKPYNSFFPGHGVYYIYTCKAVYAKVLGVISSIGCRMIGITKNKLITRSLVLIKKGCVQHFTIGLIYKYQNSNLKHDRCSLLLRPSNMFQRLVVRT